MKVKNHSLSVGFNAPDNAKTQVKVNIYPGSKQHVKTQAYLKNTYDSDKQVMCPPDCTPEPILFEFKMKMKSQAAAKQAVEKVRGIQDQVHEISDIPIPPIKFKISSIGKNLIAGISLQIPKKSKLASFSVPDDIKDVFAQTNQHVTA